MMAAFRQLNTSALSAFLFSKLFLLPSHFGLVYNGITYEKTAKSVREGFEPSVPFWGTAL